MHFDVLVFHDDPDPYFLQALLFTLTRMHGKYATLVDCHN